MIKEDIPYLESTYLLQFMVQTLNETAIFWQFIKWQTLLHIYTVNSAKVEVA